MTKWTENQQKVIDHRGGNLLVSAAAGSGKTAVMIEHIYALIASGEATLDRMLVSTFTNAAAQSMKEKLAQKLESVLEKEPDNKLMEEQLHLVDRANISTLHSFAIKLLKKYYFYTPLSPDFKIFQSRQAEMLSSAAMATTLENAAKQYNDGLFPEYREVLVQFAGQKSDKSVETAILELDRAVRALPHPHRFKAHALEIYREGSGKTWHDYVYSYAKERLSDGIRYINALVEDFSDTAIYSGASKYAESLCAYLEQIKASPDIPAMVEAFKQKAPSFSGKVTPLKARFNLSASKISEMRTELKKLLGTVVEADLTRIAPAVEGLFELHSRYCAIRDELMLNENGTTFDGVLTYLTQLLDENPQVLEDIKKDIDLIFIDEYQDINAVQNYIIELISKGNNMFFVGDIKQSIYGFNHARPELFLDKMNSYSSLDVGTRIDLMNNFRSYDGILEGVNFIFEQIMHSKEISEICYDSLQALYPSPDGGSIQHVNGVYDGDTLQSPNELLIAEGDVYSEAALVAQRIEELRKCQIIDKKTGIKRKIRYGDICILGRKTAFGARFKEVFEAKGIPYNAQEVSDEDVTDTVSTIIALLQLLINRRNDVSLITVLLSSIGTFSPTELAQIRIASPSVSFFHAFFGYTENDGIRKKIDRFSALLDRLELLQKATTLGDFIEQVINDTGYVYHTEFLPKNVDEGNKVNELILAARSYSELSGGSLRGFLEFFEHKDKGHVEAFDIDENDDSVTFMTIHKSKGLEFPIVILACLNDSGAGRGKSYYFDDELGFGFATVDEDDFGVRTSRESVARSAIKLKASKRDTAEDMRVLYVALTRPVNKLILSFAGSREDICALCFKPDDMILKSMGSYAELTVPYIYQHRDGAFLREYVADGDESCDTEKFIFDKSSWSVRIEAIAYSPKNDDDSEDESEKFDKEKYIESAIEAFSWEYPYKESLTKRTKHSPSKQALRTRIPLHRPAFDDKEFKGAQKGTAVHFFMEHFDFNSAATVKEQADKMLESGILSQQEYDALPYAQIESFVNGSFAQRIKASPLVMRERSFCHRIPFEDSGDEALVQGIIDCYFFDGDGIALLDYKTDVINGNLRERIEHHAPQLKMYAYALEELYPGKKVTPYIHFFHVDTTVKIEE